MTTTMPTSEHQARHDGGGVLLVGISEGSALAAIGISDLSAGRANAAAFAASGASAANAGKNPTGFPSPSKITRAVRILGLILHLPQLQPQPRPLTSCSRPENWSR